MIRSSPPVYGPISKLIRGERISGFTGVPGICLVNAGEVFKRRERYYDFVWLHVPTSQPVPPLSRRVIASFLFITIKGWDGWDGGI
jgi:hypothetical protein